MRHDLAAGELQPWSPGPAAGRGERAARGERSEIETWTFEAENEWPPLAQAGSAWAEPIWASDTCASPSGSGRALAIHPGGTQGGSVTIDLPVPRPGTWRVTPSLLLSEGPGNDGGLDEGRGLALAILDPSGTVLARWTPAEVRGSAQGGRTTCIDAPSRSFTVGSENPAGPAPARSLRLTLTFTDGAHSGRGIALDRISLAASPR